MATTRKTRVPREQQLQLINECRQSGLTDADWCREHDIAPSTFYNWVSRLRTEASSQIAKHNYGQSDLPLPKQEVVMQDITIRICNDADPLVLAKTLRLLRDFSC